MLTENSTSHYITTYSSKNNFPVNKPSSVFIESNKRDSRLEGSPSWTNMWGTILSNQCVDDREELYTQDGVCHKKSTTPLATSQSLLLLIPHTSTSAFIQISLYNQQAQYTEQPLNLFVLLKSMSTCIMHVWRSSSGAPAGHVLLHCSCYVQHKSFNQAPKLTQLREHI